MGIIKGTALESRHISFAHTGKKVIIATPWSVGSGHYKESTVVYYPSVKKSPLIPLSRDKGEPDILN